MRFIQWTPDGGAHWNPLAVGNATELKDKLLATERFTEPHYRRAAERYLQLAIQVALEADPQQQLTLAGVVELHGTGAPGGRGSAAAAAAPRIRPRLPRFADARPAQRRPRARIAAGGHDRVAHRPLPRA